MSEIKFKDARYYDHITQQQLAIGGIILLRVKTNENKDALSVAAEWVSGAVEQAVVIHGTREVVEKTLENITTSDKPVIVIIPMSQLDITETTHWATDRNVLVIGATNLNAITPRYTIMLARCVLDLDFDLQTGKLNKITTVRNIATMSGWVTDFTEGK